MKRIKIDRKKCIGCLTCTTACIVSHGSEDTRSRIAINSDGRYSPIKLENMRYTPYLYL